MGKRVTAMTFADDDREIPARKVSGELTKRTVSALGYTQYLVDGVLVDPDTLSSKEEKALDLSLPSPAWHPWTMKGTV